MDKLATTFEDLFRRIFAPSAAFFVLFLAGHAVFDQMLPGAGPPWKTWTEWFQETTALKSSSLVLVGLIGTGYVLATLQAWLFDGRLKGNFDRWGSKPASDVLLITLRGQVSVRVNEHLYPFFKKKEDYNDYMLYQILGGVVRPRVSGKVNEAKALGMVFTSLVVVLILLWVYYLEELSPGCHLLLFAFIFAIIWVGFDSVNAKYRARNIRLYINFLAMPPARIREVLTGKEKDKIAESPKPTSRKL